MPDRLSASDIVDLRARADLAGLIGQHVKLMRRGREYVGLCPFHKEKTPSFTVVPHKGFFFCFGCGAKGDAIEWLMRQGGLTFAETVARLNEDAPAIGRPPPPAAREAERRDRRTDNWAHDIWRASGPAAGSPVETYLRGRGIDGLGGIPHNLRYHRALWHGQAAAHFPAMVARVQGSDGHFAGIHRTYLAEDGNGKAPVAAAKMMAGRIAGGAVRLIEAGPRLALAEGIETALTVAMLCPDLPVWAALSLGNIAGGGMGRGRLRHAGDRTQRLPSVEFDAARPGVVLPRVVECVILITDADDKDRASADALITRAVARYESQGREVRIARPLNGHDFNDMLLGAA